jgi:uncharacterized protein YycO
MIQVGLYKSKGIIGTLIRWQTRGEYSHAALHLDDMTAIEAWHRGGVQRGPIGHLHKKGTVIDVYDIAPLFVEDLVRDWAQAQVGKPYDFIMVARFMSRRGESSRSKKKLFCSELVFNALQQGGLSLFKKTSGWEVSPDLLKRSPHLSYSHSITV